MGSCLDPELPGTGLQTQGGEGAGPPTPGKRVSWNPAEMGKTWEEIEKKPFWTWWRRISSQQSEKRKLSLLFIKYPLNMTRSSFDSDQCFSVWRINHLVPNHFHWSSVNTWLTSRAEQIQPAETFFGFTSLPSTFAWNHDIIMSYSYCSDSVSIGTSS